MQSQKGRSTVYTDQKRQALLYNAAHDSAVAATAAQLRTQAEEMLPKLDTLYDMIVAEGLFRYYLAGPTHDPNRTRCRYCGKDIALSKSRSQLHGIYSWIIDPLETPWKVTCPLCAHQFPTNDFASYYRLGLDQKGVFHESLARQRHMERFGGLEGTGYLKNELYPEKSDAWGIDDGFGLWNVDKDSFTDGHGYYIAMYLHAVMYGYGSKTGPIPAALRVFRDAYLYTGEIRYARAGAVLLDRIADFYPDYDWYQWHTLRGDEFRGNIVDVVWGNFIAVLFAECYDAFYPVYDDPELIAYLSAKASAQGLANPKNTGDALRKNAEDGILRTIFRDSVENKLHGNFGMTQNAVATAAVVLNTMPETGQWLDWVIASSNFTENVGPNPPKRTGGNLLAQLVDIVDRDGTGNESSPGYNQGWLAGLLQLADNLQDYELYPNVDLYKNPKFYQMLYCTLPPIMAHYYTAQIGDTGSCGGPHLAAEQHLILPAFMATGDPVFAQLLYLQNGRTAKGLRYPDTQKDPSRLETDVEAVIKTYGEFNPGSQLFSGYGLGTLRNGNRDMWMYFGSTDGHGHCDSLNLGLDAYGLNMMPDLGYPKHTGPEHNRIQWVRASLSHNTVVVDEESQQRMQDRGTPLHFDDAGHIRLMDADKRMVYPQTDTYRRTVVMVDVDDTVSYGVDFFRISGGNDHLYSFHAQSHEIAETEGLCLVKQETGTYASPDVPYGPDPSELSGVSWDQNVFTYPDGYTWLDHVEKDLAPKKQFAVDFKITDYHHLLQDPEGLHLRMTMLNDTPLDEVSIVNGYPPKKAQNPQPCLKYVLARHKQVNADTLFTAVLEPYRHKRYIAAIEAAPVTKADGTAPASPVKAVKLTLTGSRTDYVIYAADNEENYLVDGQFPFRGFVGVLTLQDGKISSGYLHDGDILTDRLSGVPAAYTGTVTDFTKAMTMENTVEITPEQKDIQLNKLPGRHIYVENDGVRSAVYTIRGAKQLENGNLLLDIGNISLIRQYQDKFDFEKGYVYDIAEGQSFRIPLSHTF